MKMNKCNMNATPCQKAAAKLAATFKANKESAEYMSVSEGNEKLQPTEKVKFLIWNLPAKTTCPYATAHCKKYCYAKAAERYDGPREMRKRNLAASKKADFVEKMIFTIMANLDRPSYKAAEEIVVRIHESGDFYNKAYAEKWLEIARAFAGDKRVKFMAYTKSVRYFVGADIPENMTVRYSLWDDTKPEELAIAESMGLPIYTAVEKFTNEPKKERCGCEDCANCKKCWSALQMSKCEIH